MSDVVHALTGIAFAAGVVAVCGFLIFGIDRFYDRRARRMAPAGFSYASLDTEGIGNIRFQLFRYQPDVLQVERILEGTDENLPVRLFLYRGVRQLGMYNSRTIQFRCAVVRTTSEFPAFVLRRKGGPMPVSAGGPPAFLTGSPAIDEAFDVACANPQFVSSLMQPEMAQWLLATPNVSYVELLGPYALVADRSPKIDRTWPQLLEQLDVLVAHLPATAAAASAPPASATSPLPFITSDAAVHAVGSPRRSRSMVRSYVSSVALVTVFATVVGVVWFGIFDRSSSPKVSVSVSIPPLFPSTGSCPTGRPVVVVTKVNASVDAAFDTPTSRSWNVHIEGTVTNRASAAIALAIVDVTLASKPVDTTTGTTKAVKLEPGQTTTWQASDELVPSPSQPKTATATLSDWSWENFELANCRP